MIIGKSPLRISLGGGGTDFPDYYRRDGGFLIAGAIDKYVYVNINKPFVDRFILKYSEVENVELIHDIHHGLIRESILEVTPEIKSLELSSLADVPAGTGLGSSGAFATALIAALLEMRGDSCNAKTLSDIACKVELERLKEPIGKQDQYVAAHGGLNSYTFNSDDSVEVRNIDTDGSASKFLQEHLMLFFTGFTRSASVILKQQSGALTSGDKDMFDFLDRVKNLGHRSEDAIRFQDYDSLNEIFLEHWKIKKSRSPNSTTTAIDELYELGIKNGASAGKVVGAGGGGFLLFLTKDRSRLKLAMIAQGISEMPFRFTSAGTIVRSIL